ncbi:hypothetical protein [Sphaerisporangium fuscum]|uniref:hypothetical protein n=1 Tax=Sphaerisporangium fuscum TaxID=2835868 RepID=UPI001BDBE42F|nr:hypothetical protein [Sphaerisporangium fuscum]
MTFTVDFALDIFRDKNDRNVSLTDRLLVRRADLHAGSGRPVHRPLTHFYKEAVRRYYIARGADLKLLA